MSRTTLCFLALLFAASAGIVSLQYSNAAVQIDSAHWTGTAAPPCFLSARDCGGHLLGTDENGRDVLARLIVGGRYTLGVAFLALAIEFGIAGALKVVTRHAGRIANAVVLYLADAVGALPRLPLVIVMILVSHRLLGGGEHSALGLAAILGLLFWPRTLRLWMHRAGAPAEPRRHAASDLVTIILLGAAVDFLGYGVFPPWPSWGNMLVGAESNLSVAWWNGVFPAVCIFVTVMVIDWLRFSGTLDEHGMVGSPSVITDL
jgi:peptide/nickel transport system permease protein